jgi:hypothetical protein
MWSLFCCCDQSVSVIGDDIDHRLKQWESLEGRPGTGTADFRLLL